MAEKKRFTRKQLDEAMDAAMMEFGSRCNITGFDVGFRWVGGQPTEEICVRIHVREKVETSKLQKRDVFPSDIDGIPLDVVQGNYRVARTGTASGHTELSETVAGGNSCGRQDAGAGTVGTIVFDLASGKPAILSNWHVLAGPNAKAGDPILQPGNPDQKSGEDTIVARLTRSILDQDGDAAIAQLIGNRPWYPIQFSTNHMPEQVRDSHLGETLQKAGGKTGVTQGRVDGEGFYRVRYEVRPGEEEDRDIRGFKIVTETAGNPRNADLSSAGDSGSAWISNDGKHAVGLHFARDVNAKPAEEHAIACNMRAVTDRLNVRLATFNDLLEQAGPELEYLEVQKKQATTPLNELSIVSDWIEEFISETTSGHPRNHGKRSEQIREPCDTLRTDRNIIRDRFESADPKGLGRVISVREDIWPRLKRALIARSSDFMDVKSTDALEDYWSPVCAGSIIAAAVLEHDAFVKDGILTMPSDFHGNTAFGHAAVSIGVLYEELGYSVRN